MTKSKPNFNWLVICRCDNFTDQRSTKAAKTYLSIQHDNVSAFNSTQKWLVQQERNTRFKIVYNWAEKQKKMEHPHIYSQRIWQAGEVNGRVMVSCCDKKLTGIDNRDRVTRPGPWASTPWPLLSQRWRRTSISGSSISGPCPLLSSPFAGTIIIHNKRKVSNDASVTEPMVWGEA